LCDQPPPPPITLTITRNIFLPVVIKNNAPPNVVPVNLNVQWQPIHYLSDEQGNPINQQGQRLPNDPKVVPPPGTLPSPASGGSAMPSGQHALNASPTPANAVASAPVANSAPLASAPVLPSAPTGPTATAAPISTTNSAPAATPAAPADTPAKQWVWLPYEGVYGYGYQRADGYWVIDEGSRQSNPPTTTASTK
jgi:hypothetical protein